MSLRPTSGFALLEVVAALALIGVGVFALLASAPAAHRLERRAAGQVRLIVAGGAVLDSLDALARLGCGALTAGSGVEPGPPAVDLRWEASAGAGLVTLAVEARVPLGADTLADTLHRVVACG